MNSAVCLDVIQAEGAKQSSEDEQEDGKGEATIAEEFRDDEPNAQNE